MNQIRQIRFTDPPKGTFMALKKCLLPKCAIYTYRTHFLDLKIVYREMIITVQDFQIREKGTEQDIEI